MNGIWWQHWKLKGPEQKDKKKGTKGVLYAERRKESKGKS